MIFRGHVSTSHEILNKFIILTHWWHWKNSSCSFQFSTVHCLCCHTLKYNNSTHIWFRSFNTWKQKLLHLFQNGRRFIINNKNKFMAIYCVTYPWQCSWQSSMSESRNVFVASLANYYIFNTQFLQLTGNVERGESLG